MNYKCMTLAVLLLPISCYSKGNEARIKELKELQYKQLLKINDIAKQMSDANNTIFSCLKNYNSLLDYESTKRKSSGNKGSNEEIKEEIELSSDAILNSIGRVIDGDQDLDCSFLTVLFNQNNKKGLDSFDTFTFNKTQAINAFALLKCLTVRYELSIHELFTINQELTRLEK